MMNIAGGTITGQGYLANMQGAFSSGADCVLQNTNSASASAHSRFYLYTTGASGGDPTLIFRVLSGGDNYAVGVDNSDSDAFVVSNSTGLGTNNRLRIDANSVAFPTLPPKLPSSTVAGVPSASTVGAGAMIYVTDESGGAVPAFSDGTAWRRVTDRAVIS